MSCDNPVTAYRTREGRNPDTGGWKLEFNPANGYKDLEVKIPCGGCLGCRLDRSREWAIRCVHEASLHTQNCFLTLTYNKEHLPPDGNLDYTHFQNFMKYLRKEYGENIRFFMCGEYGEQFSRPHYHACIFNHDFEDKKHWKTRRGNKIYRSDSLERLWKKGFSEIGTISMQSAAYTARYILKKITGEAAEKHYEKINLQTGEITQRVPEFAKMSLRPGIGKGWLESNYSDVYADDYVTLLNGMKTKPPRYYDKLYEEIDEEDLARHKSIRKDPNKDRPTAQSRRAKAEKLKRDTRTLFRNLEKETTT